jgi:hypothetical protein
MLPANTIVRLLIEEEQPVDSGFDPLALGAAADELAQIQAAGVKHRVPGSGNDVYRRLLALSNGRYRRKIDNNTYLFNHDNGGPYHRLAVHLHHTDVVVAYPDGRVVVDTGGWQTSTTRDRITKYIDGTGWSIFQQKGTWYWFNRRTNAGTRESGGELLPFSRKDTILPDGTLEMNDQPEYPRRHAPRAT